MSGLGETFRAARESQGLSLSDVADRIHIRSAYLAAIESEDWQAIGPVVYVRGFIRSYARFLNLDPDAAIARFGAPSSSGGGVGYASPPRTEPSRSGLRGEEPRPGQSRADPVRLGSSREKMSAPPSVWAVLGVLVAVVLVGFVGYEYFAYQQADSRVAATPGAPTPASPSSAEPGPAAGEARAGAQPELRPPVKNVPKSSAFAVRLKDSSWLRVTVDGKVAMEGLFRAGTSRSFSGRSVTVRVGNAGGVDVSVDGKDLGPLGGLGDVAERSFQL